MENMLRKAKGKIECIIYDEATNFIERKENKELHKKVKKLLQLNQDRMLKK